MRTDEEAELLNSMAADDQSVCDYLQRNPDFFIRNARQIEQMHVPHPVRGSVSLVEWHMSRQRHHIEQLEEEITLLMEQATANQHLFSQVIALQSCLAAADSLQDMLSRLHRWARDLGLAGASIRLFSDQWQLTAPSSFTGLGLSARAFEPVRIQRLGRQQHYLGSLNGPELLLLMPEAKAIGSVAMSLMADDCGVVMFSSRDKHHYYPGMGTELLDYLAAMLPELVSRWIKRR